MRTRASTSSPLGHIQLRLSDSQARVLKLENNRTPTVPIYEDIENDPPSIAVEGQIALSRADLQVWWYSNGSWHTCTLMNYEDVEWEQLDGDQDVVNSDMVGTNYSDIKKGPDGFPWVAFTEPRLSSFAYPEFGPYVKRWDGDDWIFLADDSADGGIGTEINSNTYTTNGLAGFALGSENVPPSLAVYNDLVYCTWGHSQYWPAAGQPTKDVAYWRVKVWDGNNWTEIGPGRHTHQGLVPSGNSDYGSARRPILRVGQAGPMLYYVDYLDTGEYPMYVSHYDGDWSDLGGAPIDFGYSGIPLMVSDMELDEDGNPIVILRDGNLIHVAHWNGSSWNTQDIDIGDVLSLPGNINAAWCHISRGEVNRDGDYRNFIGVSFQREYPEHSFVGYQLWMMEYFPATETVRPLLNNIEWAHVDIEDRNAWEIVMVKPEVSDKSVWVFSCPSGSIRLLRLDTACPLGWEYMGNPSVPGYFPNDYLRNAYLDDNPSDPAIYTENIYSRVAPADGGHYAHKASIVTSPCR